VKREALGRGLGELLDEVSIAYENENSEYVETVDEIDTKKIDPNPNQPRLNFDKASIYELSLSIKEHGLLQPIVVIRDENRYTLVSGERRLRATKQINHKTIKSIILNIDRNKISELALIENIQREDLSIVELALSYEKLIKQHNITHEQLSHKLSKSRSAITNTLRVLLLSDYVKQKLQSNHISFGHAKMLVVLDERQQQIATDSMVSQKLNIAQSQKLIQQIKEKKEPTANKQSNKWDFDENKLKKIIFILKNKNLKTTLNKKGLHINISSDEDIEKLNMLFV